MRFSWSLSFLFWSLNVGFTMHIAQYGSNTDAEVLADAEAYHGAPASVQLIGRRLDEERLLSMAQLVVEALKKHQSVP